MPMLKEGKMSFKYFPNFFVIIILCPLQHCENHPLGASTFQTLCLAHHQLGVSMRHVLLGLLLSDELHTNQGRLPASVTSVPGRKRLWEFRHLSLPWKPLPHLDKEPGTSAVR